MFGKPEGIPLDVSECPTGALIVESGVQEQECGIGLCAYGDDAHQGKKEYENK
jgi:hypothetical protein